MPFGPVDQSFDLPALETRTLARWREIDLFGRVQRLRRDATSWVFYEGPPTANGRPGLHHVWARVFKDLYPRFQTMRGHFVPRKGGWDCHGLPVEIEVEKELGLSSKHDIEAYGVAEFNQRCRESVSRYIDDFVALTERSAVWIDTGDAYMTLTNDYIESVWWLMRQIWDAGLLYEGHRVTPYCSRCGTALSSHELGQPGAYRDVVDPSAYVRFPLVDSDADLLVWTTTPWTLVSNVAAAVGPEIPYVQVRAPGGGRDLVLAEAAAERLWPEAEVVARLTGKELVGRYYTRPFDLLPLDEGASRVVAADFVATDEGSGIVHLAPAFGEDDARVAREEGLPVLNPVGPDGTFDERIGPWHGLFVKDADRGILDDLTARGVLVVEEPYEHSYPHCWRCGTPLIYWAKTSWFIATAERRDDLLRENERINWYPDHIKHGRFGKWLEGNVDWAVSRDRFWGTPLPVWRCEAGHATCIGSVAQLGELAGRDLAGLDLHRPFVDEVTFACPKDGCGAPATRVPPVLDAWFDSGSMPSAQHHYPFEAKEAFESTYPADFICEAIDQTRGWFYSLLAIGALVFDATPYKNVVCLNLVVDAQGQKMSKSRGNVIDPWAIFERHGADALRWYFFSAASPWIARRVSDEGIVDATRKTLLTLWNVFGFFVTYADIAGWQPDGQGFDPRQPSHVLDRWVLSELDDAVADVTEAMEHFDALGASTRLARFVDDLSNWYVRRSRPRFFTASDPQAHATLHHTLVTCTQLLAPFCPFLADHLYTVLTGQVSVHLADWPVPAGVHDDTLAEQVAAARRLVALGWSARKDAGVKVRQPLRRALLLHPGAVLDDALKAEIRAELNVKALEDVEALSDLMTWEVVPDFARLGPRLGPKVNEVKAALSAADGTAVREALQRDGFVEVAGEHLAPDEVVVRATRHASFALAEDGGWAAALDLELDDELRREAKARDLVRVLSALRKERDLSIADRIEVRLAGSPELRAAFDAHRHWIAEELLADVLEWAEGGGGATVEVDGEPVQVDLRLVDNRR